VPHVTLVAAIAANGVIGHDNALPWRLPGDLKHFRALTMGHAVIMGRRTFDSLGKPLPGRINIVVSREAGRRIDGASVVASLDAALLAVPAGAEAFVIGGADIYRLALAYADRLAFTEVRANFAGDVRFPDYDRSLFHETARESCVDPASGLAYDFVTYERTNAGGGEQG
jgi:dihydrofolate reductase